MKRSSLTLTYLVNVKLTVKIWSIFLTFLENKNFKKSKLNCPMYCNIGVSFPGIFIILPICLLSDSLYPITSQLLFISLKYYFLLLLTRTNSETTNPEFFFSLFMISVSIFFFSFQCILSSVVFFNFSDRNFVSAADCSGILQEFRPNTSSQL